MLTIVDIVRSHEKVTYNQALETLIPYIKKFEKEYDFLLSRLHKLSLCFTVYNPAFMYYDDFGYLSNYQKACEVTINIFNDIIQRLVKKRGLSLLELRYLMTDKSDFANSIEPSHKGGNKIAYSISKWITQQNFSGKWKE